MILRPKRYNGKFQLRTASGRLICTSQNIEEIEHKVFTGRGRVLWFWYNGKYYAKGYRISE